MLFIFFNWRDKRIFNLLNPSHHILHILVYWPNFLWEGDGDQYDPSPQFFVNNFFPEKKLLWSCFFLAFSGWWLHGYDTFVRDDQKFRYNISITYIFSKNSVINIMSAKFVASSEQYFLTKWKTKGYVCTKFHSFCKSQPRTRERAVNMIRPPTA